MPFTICNAIGSPSVGYPPAPRSIGINDLATNGQVILGLQQLTGKILRRKELGGGFWMSKSSSEIYRIGGRDGLRQVHESRREVGLGIEPHHDNTDLSCKCRSNARHMPHRSGVKILNIHDFCRFRKDRSWGEGTCGTAIQ